MFLYQYVPLGIILGLAIAYGYLCFKEADERWKRNNRDVTQQLYQELTEGD